MEGEWKPNGRRKRQISAGLEGLEGQRAPARDVKNWGGGGGEVFPSACGHGFAFQAFHIHYIPLIILYILNQLPFQKGSKRVPEGFQWL